jgi:hypothetical protein
MVLEPQVFDYIQEGDSTIFEKAPLQSLRQTDNIWHIGMKDFGCVWIPSATRTNWRSFGLLEMRHGRYGNCDKVGVLERKKGFSHRAHGL